MENGTQQIGKSITSPSLKRKQGLSIVWDIPRHMFGNIFLVVTGCFTSSFNLHVSWKKNPRIRLILWMEETPHQFVNALSHYFPLLHSHLHSFQLVQDSLIFSYMEVSQVMGLPPIMIRFFGFSMNLTIQILGHPPLIIINHHSQSSLITIIHHYWSLWTISNHGSTIY